MDHTGCVHAVKVYGDQGLNWASKAEAVDQWIKEARREEGGKWVVMEGIKVESLAGIRPRGPLKAQGIGYLQAGRREQGSDWTRVCIVAISPPPSAGRGWRGKAEDPGKKG